MRNLIFAAMAAGLIGSIYLNRKLTLESHQNTEMLSALKNQIQQLTDDLKKEHRKNLSEIQAETETLNEITQATLAQKQATDAAEERLNKARNNGENATDVERINEELLQQRDALQELERQYAVLKAKQTQLGAEGKQTLVQEKWNQTQDDQALVTQIQTKQLEVNQTTEQWTQLKKDRRSSFEAQESFPIVEAKLKDQRASLQSLKDQKKNYAQQWVSQRGLSQSQIEAQQSALRTSEIQLRDQIQANRSTLQRSELALANAKKAQANQNENLSSLEREFRNQKIKLQELQKQVLEQQKKIANFENE